MQTETLDKSTAKVAPYNEVAELIDREIHARLLEQINVLAREYKICNPSKVAEFLSENLFLLDLLKEIPNEIREIFGDEQKLVLEFFLDPEDSTWHRLFVRIPTQFVAKESNDLLDKFRENWWFDNKDRSNSKLSVKLRFIK